MYILNITYQGRSGDVAGQVDDTVTDNDIRRLAVELLRGGEVPGMGRLDVPDNAFDNFVVDRFASAEGGNRIYLRPKVPFGR